MNGREGEEEEQQEQQIDRDRIRDTGRGEDRGIINSGNNNNNNSGEDGQTRTTIHTSDDDDDDDDCGNDGNDNKNSNNNILAILETVVSQCQDTTNPGQLKILVLTGDAKAASMFKNPEMVITMTVQRPNPPPPHLRRPRTRQNPRPLAWAGVKKGA